MTEIRKKIFETMDEYGKNIMPLHRGWRVLEIGIDGDKKPGGNYEYFGIGNTYETLDILPRLEPTYVADIQNAPSLEDEMFDVVICSQTLEHLLEPIKAVKEIFRILKKGGWAIVDCPFNCHYHPQKDYDDYWRMTPAGLMKITDEAGFREINNQSNDLLTSLLCFKSQA